MAGSIKLAWSHSAINLFKQCPHRFYEQRITKSWKEEFKGPAAEWGTAVHKAMERRIKYGNELPANMSQYEKYAAVLDALPGEKKCEWQMCINEEYEPTEWFAKDAWCRSINDLTVIHPDGKQAVVVDYKTGKRKDDDKQLALQAAITFLHVPSLEKIISGFLWLGDEPGFDKSTFSRKFFDRLWVGHLPYVEMIEAAMSSGDWPKKPSGLCHGYCPVQDCKFWQPKRT